MQVLSTQVSPDDTARVDVHRATLAALLLLAACGEGEPDPRLASPQATVETLLGATHLWGAEGPDDARFAPPPDIATVARCFWDYDRDDPESRAMGDFVAGMLAAHQHGLRYEVHERWAIVLTGSRAVHFRRTDEGWQIVMHDTVPDSLQRELHRSSRRQAATSDEL
jgi:hypothetical protein